MPTNISSLAAHATHLLPGAETPTGTRHTRIIYPVKEAAQLVGMSTWTLRQMYYDCKVRGHKLAGKLLIPATEIDRLIEESEAPYKPADSGLGAIAGKLSRQRAAARRRKPAASRQTKTINRKHAPKVGAAA